MTGYEPMDKKELLGMLKSMRRVNEAAIAGEKRGIETLRATTEKFFQENPDDVRARQLVLAAEKRAARNIRFFEKQLVWIDKQEKKSLKKL